MSTFSAGKNWPWQQTQRGIINESDDAGSAAAEPLIFRHYTARVSAGQWLATFHWRELWRESQPVFVGMSLSGFLSSSNSRTSRWVESCAGDLRALAAIPVQCRDGKVSERFSTRPCVLGRTVWMASEDVLRFDLAGLALVGTRLFFHDRDAVLAATALRQVEDGAAK